MLLTQAQAQAVLEAMRALDAIDATLDATIDHEESVFCVMEHRDAGIISVLVMGPKDGGWNSERTERYDNRDAFAAAYGISI